LEEQTLCFVGWVVPSSGFTAHSASAPLLLFPWLARALHHETPAGGLGIGVKGEIHFFVAETALAPTPQQTRPLPVDFHLNTPKYP
jgi:hypothetical protein